MCAICFLSGLLLIQYVNICVLKKKLVCLQVEVHALIYA